MANHYHALKRMRQIDRRSKVNRMRKTRLRHQIRAMRKVLAESNAEAAEKMLPQTFSIVDRAAKWGIIKANTAARYKSRMHNRLKALAAA